MSHSTFESRTQDETDVPKGHTKCRIPQRLPNFGRSKIPSVKPKINSNLEIMPQSRPSSTQGKNEVRTLRGPTRTFRSEKLIPTEKRPQVVPKRLEEITQIIASNKALTMGTRHILKVPISPDMLKGTEQQIQPIYLSEMQQGDIECNQNLDSSVADESSASKPDKTKKLKLCWQEKLRLYEELKNDLSERQRAIIELFTSLKDECQVLTSHGQKVVLPEATELHMMNVANLNPEQLLQLCAVGAPGDKSHLPDETLMVIDMNKVYNLPSNLVATCENTVTKRKEIIEWFATLTTQEKGISVTKLSKKIDEFNAENDSLHCSLQKVKSEFYKEMNEVIEVLRKMMNDSIALRTKTEQLTNEVSELTGQNAELRTQLQNAETNKSQAYKYRVEELEKELNVEKHKRVIVKERLTNTENECKISSNKIIELEATLEEERSQIWSLEQEVKQLNEENRTLRFDFDKELTKLTNSIRENTSHLEEIAKAREKLQAEKKDLERRLEELNDHYNDSLVEAKTNMDNDAKKLAEFEKIRSEEIAERKSLEDKLRDLSIKLQESESRFNDVVNKLHDKESELDKAVEYQTELETVKHELQLATSEITENRSKLLKQNDELHLMEQNLRKALDLEDKLKNDLKNRDEYIIELENKQSFLEQQLETSESKIESYEEQLKLLKNHIAELQEDFGEFENLKELRDFVKQQHDKLLKTTRQCNELEGLLQQKDMEKDNLMDRLRHQEFVLNEKDQVIKMLSDKQEQQNETIKLLQNDLESRTKAEEDCIKQINAKNAEINSLIGDRKLEISHLEKIVLALEDQICKADVLRKNDRDRIHMLENRLAEYESQQKAKEYNDAAADLDTLMKLLEAELGIPMEHFDKRNKKFNNCKSSCSGERRSRNMDHYDRVDVMTTNDNSEPESVPTKIVMGNFVKKTYISGKNKNLKNNNLNRKKAITNIDMQNLVPAIESSPGFNVYHGRPSTENINMPNNYPRANTTNDNNYLMRKFLMPNQSHEEKKCKMFNFARHRLN